MTRRVYDRPRMSTPSAFHENGVLEDTLAEIAGEEQGVRAAAAECGEKSQLPATPRSWASSITAKSKAACVALAMASRHSAEHVGQSSTTPRAAIAVMDIAQKSARASRVDFR